MTQITPDQQQMLEAAAKSVAAKLEAFHESLTSDEHQVLEVALRSIRQSGEESAEDAAGYYISVGLLPLIVVKIREMAKQQPNSTSQQSTQGANRQ